MVKRIFMISLAALLLLGLIIRTEAVTQSVNESLKLCTMAVIPALFPFFVISGIMVNTGTVSVIGRVFSPVARMLFRTSGNGAVVFLIGILCGYPTGAKVTADMYREKKLEKNEAERLLAFCNNSGPLFVIGTVGCLMLSDRKAGVVLYIIHVISAIMCGIIMGMSAKGERCIFEEEIIAVNLGETVAKSIEHAVLSILNVCGYVVFFACVTALVRKYIPHTFLLSLLEVTQGVKTIISANYLPETTIVLLSGAIGFGGVCVAFQVQSVAMSAGLSVRKYLIGKTFQMCVSMVLSKIYFSFFGAAYAFAPMPATQHTFQTTFVGVFLFLLCCIFTLHRLTMRN